LTVDPEQRLSIDQALNHPWIINSSQPIVNQNCPDNNLNFIQEISCPGNDPSNIYYVSNYIPDLDHNKTDIMANSPSETSSLEKTKTHQWPHLERYLNCDSKEILHSDSDSDSESTSNANVSTSYTDSTVSPTSTAVSHCESRPCNSQKNPTKLRFVLSNSSKPKPCCKPKSKKNDLHHLSQINFATMEDDITEFTSDEDNKDSCDKVKPKSSFIREKIRNKRTPKRSNKPRKKSRQNYIICSTNDSCDLKGQIIDDIEPFD